MKTWTMPTIGVEEFAANEHVAACSWEGDYLHISCGLGHEPGADFTSPSHSYGDTCSNAITISGANWNSFSTKGTWFGSNGLYVHVHGANMTPDDYVGDHVYYVYRIKRGDEYWLIWDTYTWNGRSYGSPRPEKCRTKMGASGNPES